MVSLDECNFSGQGQCTEHVLETLAWICTQCSCGMTRCLLGRQYRLTCAILMFCISIFNAYLIETRVRSGILIAYACLVVACSLVIPRITAASMITWYRKDDTLWEMIVIGNYSCSLSILIMTLAGVLASWLYVG